MFIPSIGAKLLLESPWTFRLFYERRNASLLNLTGIEYGRGFAHFRGKSVANVRFPVGTQLTVDRMFIRKGRGMFIRKGGMTNYDSVTFFAKFPAKASVEIMPGVDWGKSLASPSSLTVTVAAFRKISSKPGEFGIFQVFAHGDKKKSVRFWAKLSDVNNINFDGKEVVVAEQTINVATFEEV
jgi:hypothetical protein